MVTEIKRSTIALFVGCILAFSGLICNGIYQANGQGIESQSKKQSEKSGVSLKFKNFEFKKSNKIQDTDTAQIHELDSKKYLRILGSMLGALAILIAGISWVMSDNHRFAAVVISLGLICLAWEYVMIAVCVAVIVLILGAIS